MALINITELGTGTQELHRLQAGYVLGSSTGSPSTLVRSLHNLRKHTAGRLATSMIMKIQRVFRVPLFIRFRQLISLRLVCSLSLAPPSFLPGSELVAFYGPKSPPTEGMGANVGGW